MLRTLTATPDDLPILQHLCTTVYALSFGNHWNEGGLEWYTENVYGTAQLTKDLASPNVIYSMTYEDDVPIAFMKIKLSSSIGGGNRDETLEVQKLYVMPEQKGKGIGKQLMDIATTTAKEHGKKFIRLEVLETNYPAIAFYERLGFRVIQKNRLDIPYFKDELRGMLTMELAM